MHPLWDRATLREGVEDRPSFLGLMRIVDPNELKFMGLLAGVFERKVGQPARHTLRDSLEVVLPLSRLQRRDRDRGCRVCRVLADRWYRGLVIGGLRGLCWRRCLIAAVVVTAAHHHERHKVNGGEQLERRLRSFCHVHAAAITCSPRTQHGLLHSTWAV